MQGDSGREANAQRLVPFGIINYVNDMFIEKTL